MQDELIFCLSMIALLCYCTQYTNTYKYMWHDMMSVPKETHVLNTYTCIVFSLLAHVLALFILKVGSPSVFPYINQMVILAGG